MTHGYRADGAPWFQSSEKTRDGLPVRLYDEGYDIWIGNFAGSRYARSHVTLDPDDTESGDYWNFNTEDTATDEITAFIDTIIESRADAGEACMKVQIIGYSLGSTAALMLSALRPETSAAMITAIQAHTPCLILEVDNILGRVGGMPAESSPDIPVDNLELG